MISLRPHSWEKPYVLCRRGPEPLQATCGQPPVASYQVPCLAMPGQLVMVSLAGGAQGSQYCSRQPAQVLYAHICPFLFLPAGGAVALGRALRAGRPCGRRLCCGREGAAEWAVDFPGMGPGRGLGCSAFSQHSLLCIWSQRVPESGLRPKSRLAFTCKLGPHVQGCVPRAIYQAQPVAG